MCTRELKKGRWVEGGGKGVILPSTACWLKGVQVLHDLLFMLNVQER